jgi:hypothetical protein
MVPFGEIWGEAFSGLPKITSLGMSLVSVVPHEEMKSAVKTQSTIAPHTHVNLERLTVYLLFVLSERLIFFSKITYDSFLV